MHAIAGLCLILSGAVACWPGRYPALASPSMA